MSSSSPPSTFSSLEEEMSYWKERALALDAEAQSAREELEEFQVGSRELEAELEAQLEQSESRLKELRAANNRLQLDNDQMRDKLEQCQHEYRAQIGDLQSELTDIRSIRDQLATYVRNLEQQNDDLERAKRSTLASLEDFEHRLNAAIERNAFLESELDEKESLKAAVQRMKDETRDLKSELRLFAPRHPQLSSLESPSIEMSNSIVFPDNDRHRRTETNNNTADSNKLAADCETKSESASLALDTPPSSAKSSPKIASVGPNGQSTPSGHGSASHPLTPSARISALNIVGDLLRKVGALELKLVSCRNIVREQAAAVGVTSANGSPVSTPTAHRETNGDLHHHAADRLKRIPRGVSTPSLKKIIEP